MPSKYTYTDEFKLEVVKNYLTSPYGIGVVAKSYDLPSKNYITRWMQDLLKRNLLSSEECYTKSKSSVSLSPKKSSAYSTHDTSAREHQLELENQRLRAEVAFLKKLKALERGYA